MQVHRGNSLQAMVFQTNGVPCLAAILRSRLVRLSKAAPGPQALAPTSLRLITRSMASEDELAEIRLCGHVSGLTSIESSLAAPARVIPEQRQDVV